MDVIFMPKHMILQRLKCAHNLSLIIHFHTGNLYCGAVTSVHVSIFLNEKINKHEKITPSIRFRIYYII